MLITIEDYIVECKKVQKEIERTDNIREKRNKRKYLHRLWKDIQEFDKYNGTNNFKLLKE